MQPALIIRPNIRAWIKTTAQSLGPVTPIPNTNTTIGDIRRAGSPYKDRFKAIVSEFCPLNKGCGAK